ncbi:Fic family protein [Arabiibacter massiliensis]|uniref:hypothetical protein n=1 Tax=Arabiibacter massiliensis TaxID=1870985 RepID=UPI0009BB5125|nr:hypothetical protein [Arabiibacter massiliensis]
MGARVEGVLEFIHDERFSKLWRGSCERAMTWQAFSQEKPPEGCTIEEAYAVVTALRRGLSLPLPFDNYIAGISEPYNWFFVTEDMHERLTDLVALGKKGSTLDSYLSECVSSRSRILLLLDEYLSLARRDGIAARAHDVRSLWTESREPRSPEDKLARNFSHLMLHIDRYRKRPFTFRLLEDLYDALMNGVHFGEAVPKGRSRIQSRKPSQLDDPDRALDAILDIAQGKGCAESIHPIFRSMLISGVFWEFFPFPTANAILELAVRNILYAKEGLPLLGWVSFSRTSELWEQGMLNDPDISWGYLEPFPDCGEGFDATSHFATELQLMLKELGYLEKRLLTIHREDMSIRSALENERYLNARQRDILLFSARNPHCRHTISNCMDLYKVAYATARQDLVDLTDMGFLSQFKQGRAFVFEATPRFFDLVKRGRETTFCELAQ